MSTHSELIEKAKQLLADNFGTYLSTEYAKFYDEKEDEQIFISVEALLTEALGSEPAKVQLKKYKIYQYEK